jgi:hypothetical protein
MTRHGGKGAGNPNQGEGRHTGSGGNRGRYPMGHARRVTPQNSQIEDRGNNDPNNR